jgi:CrcB protein
LIPHADEIKVNIASLHQLALVGIGGFVGSVLRFAISGFAQRFDPEGSFPYGTLTVNALGCLAIGLLAGLAESRQLFGADLRAFVFLGVLGGFTTFSTFGYETYELMRTGQMAAATANVLLQVTVGVAGVWLGHSAARML